MENLSTRIDLDEFHEEYQKEFAKQEQSEIEETINAIKNKLGKEVILIPLDQALKADQN